MSEERYKYCAALYSREFDIKERLEQKAGLVFAFNGAIIGATLFDSDAIDQLATAGWLARSLLALLGASLLASAVCAMMAVATRQYEREYPAKVHDFLFDPRSARDDEAFWEEIGGRFALATEHNAAVNNEKGRWLNVALYALLGSMVLVLLFTVLSLFGGVDGR